MVSVITNPYNWNKHNLFVNTLLNVQTVLFQIIQFIMSYLFDKQFDLNNR